MANRVLIAWEFGSGLGHLAPMLQFIRGLRAKGVEPLVAVPDPVKARAVFGAEAPRLLRCVPLVRKRTARGPVYSFADILLQGGFSDAAGVCEAVEGWQAIFRAERINTVLLDYAPVAQLAAWLMELKMITRTFVFANPPVPFPWIDSDTPESPQLLARSESQLLGCINQVTQQFGRKPIDTLATWLHAPMRFTTGIPQTNVFDFEPEYGYLGPLGGLGMLSPFEWPMSSRTRVLCYLRWMPKTPKIVAALSSAERDIACVVLDAPVSWLETARRAGMSATNKVVDLEKLMTTADVVVSHGSGRVACEALLKGKPQLMIPIDLEKMLTARRMETLKVGKCLAGPRAAAEVSETLGLLTKNETYSAAAKALVAKLRPEDWSASLEHLVNETAG